MLSPSLLFLLSGRFPFFLDVMKRQSPHPPAHPHVWCPEHPSSTRSRLLHLGPQALRMPPSPGGLGARAEARASASVALGVPRRETAAGAARARRGRRRAPGDSHGPGVPGSGRRRAGAQGFPRSRRVSGSRRQNGDQKPVGGVAREEAETCGAEASVTVGSERECGLDLMKA